MKQTRKHSGSAYSTTGKQEQAGHGIQHKDWAERKANYECKRAYCRYFIAGGSSLNIIIRSTLLGR